MTIHVLKHFFLCTLSVMFIQASAQDSTNRRSTHFYTGIYNELPEYVSYPVIGVVNICNGNQRNAQVGFTNVNQKNLSGVQVGFSNAAGGRVNGSQVGFVNVCRDSLTGAEIGFINLATNGTDGAQVGFVNLTRGYVEGAQVGYVNIATTSAEGAQVGFVNGCRDSMEGVQVGFVNAIGNNADAAQVGFINGVAGQTEGAQIGFVNVAAGNMDGAQVGFVNITGKKHKGLQLGFINVSDSLEDGIPFGFVSFVRKGGFMAKEISASEMYPLNLAFKTGVPLFYTTFIASFNPDLRHRFALGGGIGSNLRISNTFFFNPEALSQFTVERRTQQITSLNTLVGLTFAKRISLLAGPNLVWVHKSRNNDTNTLYEPLTSLYHEKLDARNSLHIGMKGALRISF